MNAYPTKPDTTITVGDKVRSYDFPGSVNCYVDGEVTAIVDGYYTIRVEGRTINDEPVHCTAAEMFAPLNGMSGLFGATRGVVRR